MTKLGLSIEVITGAELRAEHATLMYRYYRSTIEKMGGIAYLTRRFFELLVERMPEHVVFVLASQRDGSPVAGALNLMKGRSLYGRYWGCEDEFKHLHFEVCYYSAIEWGLARGLDLFEAGAQGEHKFNRGFTPHLTLSAHEFRDIQLASAVREFIERERNAIGDVFQDYKDHDPFKRSETTK